MHDLEMSTDGRVAFVAVHDSAWHGLGTVVDHDISVEEGLRIAHLADLDYHVVPIAVPVGPKDAPTGLQWEASHAAVIRRKPFDREKYETLKSGLSPKYTLHTPEETFGGLGEELIGQGHTLSALGSIDQGRRAFACFRMEGITLAGVDQVDNYLNVLTSFDGSMATHARVSSIRTVCRNTFNGVLGDSTAPTYKIRHVGAGIESRVDEARAALQVGWKAMEQFEAEAMAFLNREVTDREFAKITEALFPVTDKTTDIVKGRMLQRRDAVMTLWNGPTVANVRGTAWGAVNAYTEWVDWTSGTFKTEDARVLEQMTPGSRMDAARQAGVKKIADMLKIQVPTAV